MLSVTNNTVKQSIHRKARLEPAIKDAQKLAPNVFPPWNQRQTSALFSSGSRGQSLQMAEGYGEIPCGYDEDFVNPIDEDLQCSICYLALREPILTRCGHRFCRECLERHLARFVFQICQAFCYLNFYVATCIRNKCTQKSKDADKALLILGFHDD